MAKEDVELPERVPTKRKQIETALDLHIAKWLAGDSITPSERRRLEKEKERRKQLRPTESLGILVHEGWYHPRQIEVLRRNIGNPTEVHASRSLPLGLETKYVVHSDLREIVINSTRMFALVNDPAVLPYATEGTLWPYIGLARARGVETIVVFPNGTTQEASNG